MPVDRHWLLFAAFPVYFLWTTCVSFCAFFLIYYYDGCEMIYAAAAPVVIHKHAETWRLLGVSVTR